MTKFSFKKILQENLPSYNWLASIVAPLNKGFADLQLLLNNGLTFKDNMSAAIYTVTLDGTFPVYVAWALPAKPIGAWVIFCRELTGDHTNFPAALFLDWEWDGARIKINALPGITATPTAKYNMTFIAVTG